MRKKKRLAGIIVIIVCIVMSFIMICQMDMFKTENHYYVFYEDIQGLEQGAPVYIKGVKVGKVEDINLNIKQKIKVELSVDKHTSLPVGTVAMIVSGGLIGNRSIDLILSEDTEMIADGNTLASAIDPDARSVSAQITPMVETGKILLYTADSTMKAMSMLSGMGLLRRLSLGVISIDSQMTSYHNLSVSLDKQSDDIINTLHDVNNMTNNPAERNRNTNEDIKNAREKTAEMARTTIVKDMEEIRTSVVSIKDAIKKATAKDGAADKILNDPEPYKSAVGKLDTLNTEMKELKEDPPGFSILGD